MNCLLITTLPHPAPSQEWNARSRAAGLIAKKSGVGVPAAVTSLVLLVGGVATAWYHRCNAEAVRAEFQVGRPPARPCAVHQLRS